MREMKKGRFFLIGLANFLLVTIVIPSKGPEKENVIEKQTAINQLFILSK
jgi:hypothetical protein